MTKSNTLTVTQGPTPVATYTVTVGGCASVAVSVGGVATSGPTQMAEGTYGISTPSTCFESGLKETFNFAGWATSGGVAVDSPQSPKTTVTVIGNGTLTATYAAP